MSEETALAARQQTAVAQVSITKEKINQYLKSMGSGLLDQQREQFIEIAQAFNLNPFKREIYGIKYGNNFNIIVGYEVYLKRAERTGMLDGWKAWIEGKGADMVAKIVIHRKDRSHAFEWEVFLAEYDQKNAIWKSKTTTMIKKVAIAQGFRLCFPDECGGLPYTDEETKMMGVIDVQATSEPCESATDELEKTLGIDSEPTQDDDATRKAFHALGTEAYGKGWDDARKQICEGYGVGSSKDLTPDQMKATIDQINGMRNSN